MGDTGDNVIGPNTGGTLKKTFLNSVYVIQVFIQNLIKETFLTSWRSISQAPFQFPGTPGNVWKKGLGALGNLYS